MVMAIGLVSAAGGILHKPLQTTILTLVMIHGCVYPRRRGSGKPTWILGFGPILLLVLGTGLAMLEVFLPRPASWAFLAAAAVLAAVVHGLLPGPLAGFFILLGAAGRPARR